MTDETIVAVYDTPAYAARAAQELEEAGVPEWAISIHSGDAAPDATSLEPRSLPGFWSILFDGEANYDLLACNKDAADSVTIVTVNVPAEDVSRSIQILARHAPIGLDARESADHSIDDAYLVDGTFGRLDNKSSGRNVAPDHDASIIRLAVAEGEFTDNFRVETWGAQLATQHRDPVSHQDDRATDQRSINDAVENGFGGSS